MSIRMLLAVVTALAAAPPARAQLGTQESAQVLFGDTLDAPYWQALLKTFAGAVRRHGDAACLASKGLDEATLVAHGRAMLLRYGLQMRSLIDSGFDEAAFEAAFTGRAGPNAVAEMKRLNGDPDVAAFIALSRPATLAKMADDLMEQFDRYVLIKRIKLEPISSVARGDTEIHKDDPTQAMRANPTQAVDAALETFLDNHSSPALERYFDLLDMMDAARPKGLIVSVASKLGPMQYFAGVEKDLAEMCVGMR